MTSIKLTIDGGDEVSVYQYSDGDISHRFDCPVCDGTDDAVMGTDGLWECQAEGCGASGTCDHSSTSPELLTDDHLGANGHTQTDTTCAVCDWCGTVVDEEVSDE